MVDASNIVFWAGETIYVFLPAYLANATPVILKGGGALDGGREWVDGRSIFGDHKTVRGTLAGLLVGTVIGIIQQQLLRGLLLSIGAIGGDIIVSFIKRRLGFKPGAMFPVADQLGFIIFAAALISLVQPLSWERVATIMAVTVPIHYFTNVVAWLLKLKKDPW